ncbi:lysozyme inhibitor LprI family protein [Paraburkholderia rhynchosiae]|uniref:Lysozyme inhibitor LprI N-terminal domain-containing protein n=1 Tax=Paraburkholderia rhynchosiae TaxID=487049 RepID=A0A2N7WTU6_9BURK|nr:hypothetical protein [Paraburkholderia rhynchosiae]PMS32869.1 hypothetical protein C0Z16_04795 [Paraburkholderia rhynchosiae]CAB3645500.1 hypothetical protein LMG27174_00819 [Paraburkholderia rhynchosiae]
MKKTSIAAMIALASVGVHAQTAAPTYQTSFDCSKAVSYSEHAICEDADLAARDLAYWGEFQSARKAVADKKAFHDHAIAAFKERQKCTDTMCVVSWFDENENYIRSLSEDHGVASDAAERKRADDLTALAKKMDSEWQIYTRVGGCQTLSVFEIKAGITPDATTPEQFSAKHWHNAPIQYGHGGEAAEIKTDEGTLFLAHGSKVCNEMAATIQAGGN